MFHFIKEKKNQKQRNLQSRGTRALLRDPHTQDHPESLAAKVCRPTKELLKGRSSCNTPKITLVFYYLQDHRNSRIGAIENTVVVMLSNLPSH